MASSSSAKKRKSKVVFDSSKFVSEEAQIRYHDSVSNRSLIAERGLIPTSAGFPGLWSIIRQRGWGEFCAQPKSAIVPLVREFYANALEHNHRRVFVRGKQVDFNGKAINRFFKLPDIENDGYTQFIGKQVDFEEIIHEIAVPGTTWKLTDDRPITFKSIGLTKNCKALHYFLGARLMPVRHFSDINKDRAILLYCLMTGKSLDVGRFISSHIVQCYKHQSMSLFFPSLITALCVAAGVQYGPNEESLAPMAALTDQRIYGMKEGNRLDPAFQVPPIQSRASRPLTMAERLERLEGDVTQQREQFQRFTDYQYSCNLTLGEMMRQLALGMAVDMSEFPIMPGYPEPPEVPGSSQAEDTGGDDFTAGDDEEDE